MSPAKSRRWPFLVALTLLAAGEVACSFDQPGPQASATPAEVDACRSRADEVYLKQNRDAIYRADTFTSGTRDSPYTGQGVPGTATTGLSGQFARDQLYTDCIRGAPSNVGAVKGGVSPPDSP